MEIKLVRFRIRTLLFTLLVVGMIAYLSYHMISGGRGIIAYLKLNNEISDLQEELETVRAERIILEHKANLLNSNSLDLDLLEERSKEVLGYAKPNETLFITPEEK